MFRPKNCVNTRAITPSVISGPSMLQSIPSTVRLYFFVKSRFTSSSNRKRFCFIFCFIRSSIYV